ncbi:MAG: hypothetical protein AAGA43_10080 [Bacteroidota bacterium]
MEFCQHRLLVDFGLLILIWIVQLIIYPSFTNFTKDDLIEWHKKYTRLMAFIVAPLMVAQLIIYIMLLFFELSFLTITTAFMVVATWLITFLQFVPMHNAIAKGQADNALLNNLVKKNWIRIVLWSLLFMIGSFTCL